MAKFMIFLLIATLGSASYHLGQRALHAYSGNPLLILAIYYALSMSLCLVAMPLLGKVQWTQAGELLANWRVWVVSVGIILIELGFLLAYQTGGSAQWGGVAVNAMAALLLVPLSVWLFGEVFSWQKVGGIALTLLGLYFLVKK